MTRRAARYTEADLRRAVKVATQFTPPLTVEVEPDGTIKIVPSSPPAKKSRPLEPGKDIVL